MDHFNAGLRENPLRSRKDMQDALAQICGPLKKFYSPGCAQLIIGSTGTHYLEGVARMEAFARPLWGLVPLLAGGGESDLLEIYLQGIKNGTNPKHPEYWGAIGNGDQRMVEMAVIGLALFMIPGKIWHPLTAEEKSNAEQWLNQINHFKLPETNWLFFRVLVNLGLKKVEANHNSEILNKDLSRLDDFYLSDGWYQDGFREQLDYYVPFAMHFYGLVYSKIVGDEDKERSERYKERAVLFAKDFIYWFSSDGSSIPFGRSLTYRFAQSGFWSALAFADTEALPWGVIKGIVLRNLRWWFQQPIFSSDGILTIGYAYPNLIMAENYNSPGSPYWALKTFMPLALEEQHPFWQAAEEELPELPSKSVQVHPHMILCRQDSGKHVVAYTSGQYAIFEPAHNAAKYEKFAYSNLFGFSVPKCDYGLGQGAYDSMLAVSEEDNIYRVRRTCADYRVNDNYIYSKWLPWRNVEVRTWIIPLRTWHIRIHRIDTKRILDTAEGGFALAREQGVDSQGTYKTENNSAILRHPWGISGILDLLDERTAEIVKADPNTNVLANRTMIPTLRRKLGAGSHLLACAVLGAAGGENNACLWSNPPQLELYGSKAIITDVETGNRLELSL
jgi:hypothetical protein